MTTLDDILNATCEITGVDREKITSRRRIGETHQLARIVYCRVASDNAFSYSEIGNKINRHRQNVHRNVKHAKTDRIFEYAIKEVLLNLKKGKK